MPKLLRLFIATTVLLFAAAASLLATAVHAQTESVCGWFENAPTPHLFAWGSTNTLRSSGQEIPNDQLFSLDLVSERSFEHYALLGDLAPGYYRIYDPIIEPGSEDADFIMDFSGIEPVSSCESAQPASDSEVETASPGDTEICGYYDYTPRPNIFVSGTKEVFHSSEYGDVYYDRVVSLYFLSDYDFEDYELATSLPAGYYRIYDPVIKISNNPEAVDRLTRFSRMEPVESCDPLQQVPPSPTPTPTRTPTPSSASAKLVVTSGPWATRCTRTTPGCLPYYLSVADLPEEWQPHAIAAATMWADETPLLQYTQRRISKSERTLIPTGFGDWLSGQPLGELRLAPGEIRIVPESALATDKLPQGFVALGIPYANQSQPQQPIAGLIILAEDPPLHLRWGLDGKWGLAKLDLQTLIAHELGHIFGICDHDADPHCDTDAQALLSSTVMHSYEEDIGVLAKGLPRRKLTDTDLNLIYILYPAASPGDDHLPVAEPTPAKSRIVIPTPFPLPRGDEEPAKGNQSTPQG